MVFFMLGGAAGLAAGVYMIWVAFNGGTDIQLGFGILAVVIGLGWFGCAEALEQRLSRSRRRAAGGEPGKPV